MHKLLVPLSFVLALGFSSASADESSPLTSLITGEDVRGWEAVGRLNLGTSGFCTAALIAPDLLLTAAHCVFDNETGRAIATNDMEFLAGWRNNRATAYRGIARAIPHPDYDIRDSSNALASSRDVAVLKLDRPIRNTSIQPFATGEWPRKGAEVDVVSYAHDRADRPSLQEGCQVLARPANSLVLSCSVSYGSSGAPVFVVKNGQPEIVSVVSSMSEIYGRKVSLGSALTEPLGELLELMSVSEQNRITSSSPVRRIPIEAPRDGSGAKFLRP